MGGTVSSESSSLVSSFPRPFTLDTGLDLSFRFRKLVANVAIMVGSGGFILSSSLGVSSLVT